MSDTVRGPPVPVAVQGLGRLLETEARLDAHLAAREREAAALVTAAQAEGEARLADLVHELDRLVADHQRDLEAGTALRLAEIDADASDQLARLQTLSSERRSLLVAFVVTAVVDEVVGRAPS